MSGQSSGCPAPLREKSQGMSVDFALSWMFASRESHIQSCQLDKLAAKLLGLSRRTGQGGLGADSGVARRVGVIGRRRDVGIGGEFGIDVVAQRLTSNRIIYDVKASGTGRQQHMNSVIQ